MRTIIRISRNSLSFAAADAGGTVGYEPYATRPGISAAANLRQAFGDSRLLAGAHGSALLLTDSPVLLVPDEEFSPDDAETVYDHAFGPDKSRMVAHCKLQGLGAVAAFAVSRDLRLVLDDNFGDVDTAPVMLPVWRHMHHRRFADLRRKMFACFHDASMDLFAFHQSRFAFCNTFEARSAADSTYYLLNVWRQMGFKADREALYVAGDGPVADEFAAQAGRYLKGVTRVSTAGETAGTPAACTPGMPLDMRLCFVHGTV